MKVIRSANRKTNVAPASNFTGTVFSDEVVVGTLPSRMRGSVVSFTPGARTAWHSHPVGQTLFCLSGAGRVQREGEQVQEIRAGDTVIIPPENAPIIPQTRIAAMPASVMPSAVACSAPA